MAKGLSGVGLMDIGTLDALKKFYATKIAQPAAPLLEKEEITDKKTSEQSTPEVIALNKKNYSTTC
ncbi:MAG: hypothetical protein HYZ44_12435 [Bacteroidetes bacterium]|nr:hypothetical protein [Bacteroidota bacterium]